MENLRAMATQRTAQKRGSGLKKILFSLFAMIFFNCGDLVAAAEVITIEQNTARSIELKGKVTGVFVANPEIADVQIDTSKAIYIYGKAPGQTSMIAANDKGEQVLNLRVVVTHNIEQLSQLIRETAPNDMVQVRSVPGGIVLEGNVESPAMAQNIKTIAEKYLGKDQTLVNNVSVRSPVQVNLKVKIAEVNRSVINTLGINWSNTFPDVGNFSFGMLSGRGAAAPNTLDKNLSLQGSASSLTAGYTDGKNSLNATIDMLARERLVTILAEPNLVAVSGETASFLAGGEYPYPIPQSDGTITIEFKQFGVSLAFTPTVLGDKLISMRVRPEVSQLDRSQGVKLADTEIPGITTRRAETTIELGSGQSFAIGGLFKNEIASNIDAIPGLGDLPILGSLFRSNAFNRGETELVIIVTAYLVNPVSGKDLAVPTDGLNYASFVEQVLDRKLARTAEQKGEAAPLGARGVRLVGPAGFSVE